MRRLLQKSRTLETVVLVVGLLAAAGGCSPPSGEDAKRLEALRTRYAERYRFEFEAPNYIQVVSKTDNSPETGDLQEIFKAFVMAGERSVRRDTDYLYVNAYDRKGAFQRQLYWDPQAGRIVEGHTEYY